MASQQINSTKQPSYFIQEHSVAIRIWHWLTFLIISGSIITVLLNSTLFDPRENIEMVQAQLESKGVIVTSEQAFTVSHEYEDKVWGVHKWLGISLATILLIRVVIEISHSSENKIRTRIKEALRFYRQNDDNKKEYRHYLGVKIGYLIFYILLLSMAITGVGLAFGRNLGFSGEFHNTIKKIHSIGQYFMYGFIIVHLSGIILAENKKSQGIVSGMINGNKFLILVFMLFSVSSYIQAQGRADTESIKRKFLDVAYDTKSPAQKLDIFLPDSGNGPFPVIMSVHGGAFKAGDKGDNQVAPMLEGLKRGYAVVSINYRLSGEAIFPAQIYDVKAAVRWIKANSEKYKLHPDRIAAWGGSAGGHLSSLVGLSGDVKELEDLSSGNSNQSSRVTVVVDWFGPTDFLKMDEQLKESIVKNPQIHSVPDSPESELIGKNLDDAPELVKAANPETYITPDDPPFFIQHGLIDHLVPYQQSENLARKLEKVIGKDKVTLILLPKTDHGGPNYETEDNLNKVFMFLDKYMK